jgi:DNA-directed DNA polymerase III PolC
MKKLVATPHCHIETFLSGSTVENFVLAAKKAGRKLVSYTDHSFMTAALKTYEMAKTHSLGFAPGVEIFVDPAIAGLGMASKTKYGKLTIHAPNQEIYQKLFEILSGQPLLKTTFYNDPFPMVGVDVLAKIAEIGCLACTSDVNDLISKSIILDDLKSAGTALKTYRDLFKNRFYVSIIGAEYNKTYISIVKLSFSDGTQDWLRLNDRFASNRSQRSLAVELVDSPGRHTEIKSFIRDGVWIPVDKKLVSAENIDGFMPIKGGDLQLKANNGLLKIADSLGIKTLYSDYAYYASANDKAVQDVRLSSEGIREYAKHYVQNTEEAVAYLQNKMGLPADKIDEIMTNNEAWASSFDNVKFSYEYSVPEVEGQQDPLKLCMEIIKSTGRMKWEDPVYLDRLKREIKVLAQNGKINLLPYFLPIRDVLNHYKENGRLTGPARGSAAGSLFMYLLGITQVDPIKYDLSFERFLSLDRILTGNWPDVDVDLVNRELLVGKDECSGYLYGRWGNKAAQISIRTNLRLKSSIKDVNRYLNGKVEEEIERLTKILPAAPQGVSDVEFLYGFKDSDGNPTPGLIETSADLKGYIAKRPKEWEMVQKCLGIPRQSSKHASAFVIADKPIESIVPVFMGRTTQFEAKEVEKAKLIKYDFLVVKQLEDIESCIKLIGKRLGSKDLLAYEFDHNGKKHNIWDLPEDPDVFASAWEGGTETLFQINTKAMRPFVMKIKPRSVEDLSTILALVRPGPLDFIDEVSGRNMAEEYIYRRNGKSSPDIQELADILPETYGVMVYQEQVSKISRILGNMPADQAEELRRVFSKKDKKKSLAMKPLFMDGATKKLGAEKAEVIWAQMETFSRYGFNKSHSVSYAIITYACMFLKFYYPLEWWTAVLSNAKDTEISEKYFKHVKDLLVAPDINLSGEEMVIDYSTKKIRSKLTVLAGLGDSVAASIVKNRPYSSIKDFVKKNAAGPEMTKRLIFVGVMDSLFKPGATLIQKMFEYETAAKEVAYENKLAKGVNAKSPGAAKIDPKYMSMSELDAFVELKKIIPTLPRSLSDIIRKSSRLVNTKFGEGVAIYFADSQGTELPLVPGEALRALEDSDVSRDRSFCSVGYVIETSEFNYAKNTKKALRVIFDCDGFITEKVMWPDYNTGKLKYPKELEKGSIAFFFMRKRPKMEGKPLSGQPSIYDIKLEKA